MCMPDASFFYVKLVLHSLEIVPARHSSATLHFVRVRCWTRHFFEDAYGGE
jgi:hypothetical protein